MALQRLHPSRWSLVLCNLKLPLKRRKFSILLEINTSLELQLLILSRTRPIPAGAPAAGRGPQTGAERSSPPLLFSAFLRRCCPRRGPRRHPACGYFYPPAFSWNPCRRASSFPARRQPPGQRSCRSKIRHMISFQSLLFRHGSSMAERGRIMPEEDLPKCAQRSILILNFKIIHRRRT